MKVIVVGGGRIGEALSRVLAKERHDVVLIEKNERVAEELADNLDALVLHGDGSDKNLLRDANISSTDIVIAATNDDRANVVVCTSAKDAKVPTVVARINQRENEKDFSKAGVESLVDATSTAVLAFKKAIERPGRPIVGFVAGGMAEVFEIAVKKESKLAGKLIAEIAKDFSVACIFREDKFHLPKSDMKIKEGDILTICAPVDEVRKIECMF
jgi:trk system potassium uptake protein TrkA